MLRGGGRLERRNGIACGQRVRDKHDTHTDPHDGGVDVDNAGKKRHTFGKIHLGRHDGSLPIERRMIRSTHKASPRHYDAFQLVLKGLFG
jgi:hypothetical protein